MIHENPLSYISQQNTPQKHPWLVGILWEDSSSLKNAAVQSSSRQCGSLLLRWLATKARKDRFSASLTCTSVAGSLAELPALSFQNLLHLIQDLLFLRRALTVLGAVRRRDDHRFVRDHLDIVPADGNVTVNVH